MHKTRLISAALLAAFSYAAAAGPVFIAPRAFSPARAAPPARSAPIPPRAPTPQQPAEPARVTPRSQATQESHPAPVIVPWYYFGFSSGSNSGKSEKCDPYSRDCKDRSFKTTTEKSK